MADQDQSPDAHEEPRRGFMFQFATAAIAAVVGIVPAVTAGIFAFNPLIRNKQQGDDSESGEGFVNLKLTMEALPDDGTPQAVKVYDDKVDAWNKFKDVEIGTVWLRRIEDQVIAFSTTCPHLGCRIDYRSGERDFYCPCHTSTFNLDGEKQNQIPPRNMDELEIRPDEETGELWLKYVTYRAATPEKEPV